MLEAVEQFIRGLFEPDMRAFWGAVLIFTIIGQFTSLKLFTRRRAYAKGRWQWFWWWGRETLMLHPIGAGIALGLYMGGDVRAEVEYYAVAGAVSLFFWSVLKGVLKARGIEVLLPGTSERPPK